MNADLENELAEFPELAPVVARLRAGRELEVGNGRRISAPRVLRLSSSLLAASVLAVFGLSVWFRSAFVGGSSASASYGAREYRLTTDEMIASQNADGSWQNDFLTRRNAEALRGCDSPAARIAYKKAVRNLRSRGIL